jgi:hypothetical protein
MHRCIIQESIIRYIAAYMKIRYIYLNSSNGHHVNNHDVSTRPIFTIHEIIGSDSVVCSEI